MSALTKAPLSNITTWQCVANVKLIRPPMQSSSEQRVEASNAV